MVVLGVSIHVVLLLSSLELPLHGGVVGANGVEPFQVLDILLALLPLGHLPHGQVVSRELVG